jgi:hypothetical protein
MMLAPTLGVFDNWPGCLSGEKGRQAVRIGA